MPTAAGPAKCAFKADEKSPFIVYDIERPSPSPGQNSIPIKSKKQSEIPEFSGFIVPSKSNPILNTIHSECLFKKRIFILRANCK